MLRKSEYFCARNAFLSFPSLQLYALVIQYCLTVCVNLGRQFADFQGIRYCASIARDRMRDWMDHWSTPVWWFPCPYSKCCVKFFYTGTLSGTTYGIALQSSIPIYSTRSSCLFKAPSFFNQTIEHFCEGDKDIV